MGQRFRPMGKIFYQRTFEAFPEKEDPVKAKETSSNNDKRKTLIKRIFTFGHRIARKSALILSQF